MEAVSNIIPIVEEFNKETHTRQVDFLTDPYRPKIITLCGSTRFHDEFVRANYELTMRGAIVLSVGFFPHAAQEVHGEGVGATSAEKEALDLLHKKKIKMSDEVFVLNVGGYLGSSTRSEIAYAHRVGVPVRYLELHYIDSEV